MKNKVLIIQANYYKDISTALETHSWGLFCRLTSRPNEGKMKLAMPFLHAIVLLVLAGKINKLTFYIVKHNSDTRSSKI